MELEQLLGAILVVLIILLIKCYLINKRENKRDYFSLSKKPMEHDWSMAGRNPYDDIDYITPEFVMIKKLNIN
jgi:hypothetical protein